MPSNEPKKDPIIELETSDLSGGGQAFCPHPRSGMQTWNTHPRVFLDISSGQARCPYCSCRFHLKGSTPSVHSS